MTDDYDDLPDVDIPIAVPGVREITSSFNPEDGSFNITWNNNLSIVWTNPRQDAILLDIIKRWQDEPLD